MPHKDLEKCPHCLEGWGRYVKRWDMKQRRQVKGQPKGTFEETKKFTRVKLYKCQKCLRNFRVGETLEAGSNGQ